MPVVSTSAVPWYNRIAALLEVASDLGSRVADTHNPRRRTALLGLRSLAAFASKHYELFGNGFDAQGALEPDPGYPAQFLLEVIGRQVAFDIDVLTRALAQRDEANTTPSMRVTLDLADHLAAYALAPAIRHQWIEETAVLTYFQKAPTVRLLPYAPLALIGFDIVAIQDSGRLLALAHEAGHHVYRQMTINYLTDLDTQVESRAAAPAFQRWPAWLVAWYEEIYADVYSALVAGPVAGLAMQAMLMAGLPAALTRDDGDHPLPALRPAIFTTVLQRQAAAAGDPVQKPRLAHAATALEMNWAAYLSEHRAPAIFTPADGSGAVTIAQATALVTQAVNALLDEELSALLGDGSRALWSDGLDAPDPEALDELYAQFATTLLRVRGEQLPELTATTSGHRVKVMPQIAGVNGGERATGQMGDAYLDRLRDEALAGKRRLAPDDLEGRVSRRRLGDGRRRQRHYPGTAQDGVKPPTARDRTRPGRSSETSFGIRVGHASGVTSALTRGYACHTQEHLPPTSVTPEA